ncbi:MAG TPA: dienelactone hydrolase family protein [Candidatus Sumerlaeota bacterium]|nr:dienelactone hydrolase family protein [Candidatus Sumerlaeota bacterium]HPK01687.1 dienelactone hydrolase family protein [Candidatus Sumerlaeota bacterium]
MHRTCLALLGLLTLSGAARAAIHAETVEYQDGETKLVGYLAYDDAMEGPRPGVIVVHEWWGLGEHVRTSAQNLARMGYAALAIDMYGEGRLTDDPREARELSSQFKNDPALARARFEAGMKVLREHAACDPERIAAIGYCFGGTVVLSMARQGLDLDGVVSFHGGLSGIAPAAGDAIKAAILVLHGGDDPAVPPADLTAYIEGLKAAGADWEVVIYGGAVHSFTNPQADGSNPGSKYHPEVAGRAWGAMRDFLARVFEKPQTAEAP